MNNKKIALFVVFLAIIICGICTINLDSTKEMITKVANSSTLSNTKIGWGVKREKDHKQPDLGSKNMQILQEGNGIAIGNNEKKYVYLTFDEGYEAGYTKSILQTLKNNNVKATFFITAHYLNTQEDLVKQMIDEGHIVGNHIPLTLMTLI